MAAELYWRSKKRGGGKEGRREGERESARSVSMSPFVRLR